MKESPSKVPPPHDIPLSQAHRYLIPAPEISAALMLSSSLIDEGEVEAYRNIKTGGLALGYNCGGCDTHHPLIDIEFLDDADLSNEDRFLMPARGSVPYINYLDATGGLTHSSPYPHQDSRSLINGVRRSGGVLVNTKPEDLFMAIDFWVEALLEGGASFALDRKTGRTVIGAECPDCDRVHADFSVDIPDIKDLSGSKDYSYIGNPFLDLILEDTGELRH